jgi:hypothetical protein
VEVEAHHVRVSYVLLYPLLSSIINTQGGPLFQTKVTNGLIHNTGHFVFTSYG